MWLGDVWGEVVGHLTTASMLEKMTSSPRAVPLMHLGSYRVDTLRASVREATELLAGTVINPAFTPDELAETRVRGMTRRCLYFCFQRQVRRFSCSQQQHGPVQSAVSGLCPSAGLGLRATCGDCFVACALAVAVRWKAPVPGLCGGRSFLHPTPPSV